MIVNTYLSGPVPIMPTAFSGVGAIVASVVTAECPVGEGVCGVYSESP